MSVKSIWTAALIASFAVLAIFIWFQVSTARHWTPVPLPYGLHNPGLAMQMAKQPWPTAMLDAGQNRAEIIHQQYIDYAYIPSYLALFLFVAILQSHSTKTWVSMVVQSTVVLLLIGVTFDLEENRAILKVTEWGDPEFWGAIRIYSMPKWGTLFMVILYQSPFYLMVSLRNIPGRLLARIIGVASIFTGLFGIYSITASYEKGIEIATLPLLVSMLIMPVFFWLGRREA